VRRDGSFDVALVALVFVVMLIEVAIGQKADAAATPLAVALIFGGVLPLLWRRRSPTGVFVVTALMVVPMLETRSIVDTVGLPAAVAAFSLALHGNRSHLVPAGIAAVPYVVLLVGLYSPHGILAADTLKNVALVCLPLAAGCAVRERRAHVRELHERLATAERTREEEALRRVEQERLSIARDLHDVVAHSMVAINVQAGVAAHLVDRRPEQAHEALKEIKRVSGEALADLRSTLGVLRASDAVPTRPAPAIDAVDELAAGLRSAGKAVTVDVDRGTDPIPKAIEAAGYRIVQEALTNVLRHAPHAEHVDVRVAVRGDRLEIEVVDDGPVGALVGAGGTGNGVRGIRERAAAVGGSAEAGPLPGGGWRVHAALPLR
jgi:signal transduction histidine kinase